MTHKIIEAIDKAELDVPKGSYYPFVDLEIRACAKAIVESQDGSKIQDFRLTTSERGKVIELLEEVGVGSALVQEVIGLA